MKETLKCEIDYENSFYCGDAAGRRTDFSNDDLLFSININFKFMTPEMYFNYQQLNFPVVAGVKLPEKYKKDDIKSA